MRDPAGCRAGAGGSFRHFRTGAVIARRTRGLGANAWYRGKGPQLTHAAQSWRARTAASSNARDFAPCAKKGSVGWAASRQRATRSVHPYRRDGMLEQAPKVRVFNLAFSGWHATPPQPSEKPRADARGSSGGCQPFGSAQSAAFLHGTIFQSARRGSGRSRERGRARGSIQMRAFWRALPWMTGTAKRLAGKFGRRIHR